MYLFVNAMPCILFINECLKCLIVDLETTVTVGFLLILQ